MAGLQRFVRDTTSDVDTRSRRPADCRCPRSGQQWLAQHEVLGQRRPLVPSPEGTTLPVMLVWRVRQVLPSGPHEAGNACVPSTSYRASLDSPLRGQQKGAWLVPSGRIGSTIHASLMTLSRNWRFILRKTSARDQTREPVADRIPPLFFPACNECSRRLLDPNRSTTPLLF